MKQSLIKRQGLVHDENQQIQWAAYAPNASVRPFFGRYPDRGVEASKKVWPLSGDVAQKDYERRQQVFGKERYPDPTGEPYPLLREGIVPPSYRYPPPPANHCLFTPFAGVVQARPQ